MDGLPRPERQGLVCMDLQSQGGDPTVATAVWATRVLGLRRPPSPQPPRPERVPGSAWAEGGCSRRKLGGGGGGPRFAATAKGQAKSAGRAAAWLPTHPNRSSQCREWNQLPLRRVLEMRSTRPGAAGASIKTKRGPTDADRRMAGYRMTPWARGAPKGKTKSQPAAGRQRTPTGPCWSGVARRGGAAVSRC